MTRFALIPFAIFASACADTTEIEETLADAETEVRELLDSEDVDAEKGALADPRFHKKVLRVAKDKFTRAAAMEGCKVVGATFGSWADRSYQYRGIMLDGNARPMAATAGVITYESNYSGEFNGRSYKTAPNMEKLMIEGDWRQGAILADVFSFANNQPNSVELTLFGEMRETGVGGGHFIGALAKCL